MKRTRIEVRWLRRVGTWAVLRDGVVLPRLSVPANKAKTVSYARLIAHQHEPSQLIVKNKNGRIAFEHTYPRSSDPRRHKG